MVWGAIELNVEKLRDYESDESEQFDVFVKQLEKGEVHQYPSPERFRRLTGPVAKRAVDSSLWPQVPIFGSLIIPIFPTQRESFSKVHRFEVSEIARLVDFCKETGQVQFTLAARPTQFAGMDYLDPLLNELRPPVVRAIPPSAVFEEASLKRSNIEFDTMAAFSLWPLIKANLASAGLDREYALQNYDVVRSAYSVLKLLGYQKVVAQIDECILSDAPRAHRILYLYNQFVQGPMFDPLKGVYCFSWDYLKGMKRLSGSDTNSVRDQFPCEIGASLMKSVTLAPESLEACRDVAALYGHEDVTRLVGDLGSAVSDSKLDVINSTSAELTEALQNVWDEARNRDTTIKGVSYGLSFGMAAGGVAAGQVLSASPERVGLLSGLGFNLLDKGVESATDGVSTRTARAVSKSYSMSFHNFQKKHRLEKS